MVDGEALYECGIDIDSSLSFEDGDLKLSKYDDNLIQAVTNRLNTNLDELELFYEDYGSVITGFLGWPSNETTLEYIQTEINTVLGNEPRIVSYESNIEYLKNGLIRIGLAMTTSTEIVVETNLILNKDGTIEVETDETEEEE